MLSLDKLRKQSKRIERICSSTSPQDIGAVKVLEKCLSIPLLSESEREVEKRLLSADDEHFHSVCFELILAKFFVSLGYTVEEHPTIPDINKHPDFLITNPASGESFYLELATIIEHNESSLSSFRLFIDKLKCDGVYVNIKNIYGRTLEHEAGNRLKKEIKSWWDANRTSGFKMDRFAVPDGSFIIELEILESNSIGLTGQIVHTKFNSQLLDKLKKKANRYGRFNRPYIIAVTFRPSEFSCLIYNMQDLLVQTLYGGGSVFDYKTKKYVEPKNFWNVDREKGSYSNVSGVLFFDELTLYRAGENINYCLFLNSKANYKVTECLKKITNIYYVTKEHTYSKPGVIFSSVIMS